MTSILAHGQLPEILKPETNAVLESSVVLDRTIAIQGNKTLKIERLSTPDEDLLKSLESEKTATDSPEPDTAPETPLSQKSYFISAQIFDHTYTLLRFWPIESGQPVPSIAWTNITAWDELAASPGFATGDIEYSMMILSTSAQVTAESPPLPTTLPNLLESGAYFQNAGEQNLTTSDLDFLEKLHLHYELRKNAIRETHQNKIIAHQDKVAAQKQEALQQKTLTLRFWRQEDKPSSDTTTPSE